MTRLGKRWLKNTYQTISSILQFTVTLLPGAFINSHCQSSKGHGTSSDFDIYASMSFSTSTLVLHESGSIVFGSRNSRDHKSRDYPHTCSGRYGLELFLEKQNWTVINLQWFLVFGAIQNSGKNIPLKIIELGAGMETLMADILKVRTERFSIHKTTIPDKSIRVHLVEISPTMRATQKANIRNGDRTNVHWQVHWHDTI